MKFKSQKPRQAEPDITPMIDIVFQLIAFFMVVINFAETQADERVQLPSAELARPADQPPEDPLTLNVGYLRDSDRNIIPDENFPSDPLHPWVFWQDEVIRIDQLAPRLATERRFRRALSAQGGRSAENMTVIVRADADVPGGAIQELMQVCQSEGFEKFILRAESERPD